MEPSFYTEKTKPGVRAEPEVASLAPKQIGIYPIEGVLEKGGMSDLFLAIDPKSHEPLVIKVLAPRFVTHPEMKERFHREAEVIKLADHPNIIKLYDHGEWEGGLYIAIEFIRGISLRQLILQHTFSLRRALVLVLQVASAIEHLHSHGVIHRDLKPENILLTTSGGIKVIDFGIAQLGPEPTLEEEKRLMGTPTYMSPEQQKNPLNVTPATDIYSLGIIIYELAIGRATHGHIELGLVPSGLQKILAKALEKNPIDRYQSASEFASDLSSYLESDQMMRDQKGYAQDVAESLRLAQTSVLPAALPKWKDVEIGLASHQDLNASGLYYDFFTLEDGRYGVLLGEPSSTGVDGVIHAALLQGIFHALPTTENVDKVNQILVAHPIEQAFTLNMLLLDPIQSELHYLSCGYGPLWLIRAGTTHPEVIHSNNIALGIDLNQNFLSVRHSWNVGDSLILSTLHASGVEENFSQALQQVLYSSPQNQAEAILRRMVYSEELPTSRRPMTVISLHRK